MRPMYTLLILGLYCLCGITVFLIFEMKTPDNCPHEFMYGDTCKNPNTLARGLRHFADMSPLYEVFSLNASDASHIDNVCYTFFHLDLTSYLIFKSVVYHNNTGEITLLVESEVSNRPGVFRAASKPGNMYDVCSTQEYLLGRYNCTDVNTVIYYFYTCFLHGDCKRMSGPQDVRHTLTSTPPEQISKTCYKLAMSDLKLKTLEFQGRIFTVFPNKLRKRCVTSFNGALAINAHKVDQEDELAYP
ncbi:uncharacterized protein LOC128997251 isoform X2 [Macrosteles quadrilineatus]|nr:uncharacterized protein LOC128997251 isoform X2 [Macrosteles quadrilineatus]